MTSREREPIMGVWGKAPMSVAQEQRPWSPPGAEGIFLSEVQIRRKFVHLLSRKLFKYTFERILLHFCLKSLYWSLHCYKKWGLRSLKALEFKKWAARA